MSLEERLNLLEQRVRAISPVAVAVSGGVDSMTLAFIIRRIDPECEIYHALSPAVPVAATRRVQAYAGRFQWNLKRIDAGEMNDPDYRKNPVNRCYYCKRNLYGSIRRHTGNAIVSGTNLDDLSDYRPGLQAAGEHQVFHPYVEAGIDKNTVRALAGYFGLTDLQALPAAPCLSSRMTTGIEIDPRLLLLVDEAETRVRKFLAANRRAQTVRCRIRPGRIAIELDAEFAEQDREDFGPAIRELVAGVFADKAFPQYSSSITIEPYTRGSAFIRVRHEEQ